MSNSKKPLITSTKSTFVSVIKESPDQTLQHRKNNIIASSKKFLNDDNKEIDWVSLALNIKKINRVELRVPELKFKKILTAAALTGSKSTTEFVLSAAMTKAEKIIEEQDRILKSEADRELFFSIVFNPVVTPSETFLNAVQRYKSKVKY